MINSNVKNKKNISKNSTKKSQKKKPAKKSQKKKTVGKKIIKKKEKQLEKKVNRKLYHCEHKNNSNLVILDNNYSIKLCLDAEKTYIKNMGNMLPGDKTKIVDDSKSYILNMCNASNKYSVFFTSGESEANNIFLCSAIHAYKKIKKTKPHVIVSSTEHISIITYVNSLKDSDQIELTYIFPNIYGCILSEHIMGSIKSNTCCVSIAYVNNDLGSVNNIEKISSILHEKKIPLHSNCTLLFGKHKLDLTKTNIDAATISFDTIDGPHAGAIIIKNDLLSGYKLAEHSIILNNKQKQNIPAIASSIDTIKQSILNRTAKNKKILKFRNEIIDGISKKYQLMTYPDYINSDEAPLESKSGKLILLGPPVSNESYYIPSILSFILLGKKNKSAFDIKKELEKKNIIMGVPDIQSNHTFESLKIPQDTQKFIVKLTLPDYLQQTHVDMFINELSKFD